MGRKKNYHPKRFESTGENGDPFLMIFESMLVSQAFLDLTKNHRLLYVYLKAQFYGKRKPENDIPDIDGIKGNDVFYFNRELAVRRYKLYTDGNRSSFYADIKELEKHGFIITVSNGRATKSKSIYKFSDKWQTWNDSS